MTDARKIETAIKGVKDQKSFIQDLLVDTLLWPIDERSSTVEEISFDWSAEDLRAKDLDKKIIDGTIRQIQPIAKNPWGIFILEFKNPDVFTTSRGLTGPLRQVLRGLVPSKRKSSHLTSFDRENLLFICTHKYQYYRFAHFKAPPKNMASAPLASFGWEPGDAIRTLCEFNLNSLEWPDEGCSKDEWHDNWQKAFDVEKVTKRFYEDYAAVFAKVEDLIKREKEVKGEELRMFTQSLFNRLMFLRFIERKGWLTFDGKHDYLRALHEAGPEGRKSFYQSRVKELFFEGLAKEGYAANEKIGSVPFLNGGLFEPSELDRKVTDIPDEAFKHIIGKDGLFYRYNFTVEESTPLDIEVAVDPEMLGKVFEELVTGRHESGSYYTPRPVVSFMCREALKGYLADKTKASITAIESLVDKHELKNLSESHAREILQALDDVKAVDPACGSGAYLLGLLQEMVILYDSLLSEKLVRNKNVFYELKLRIISHNLYGVDIDKFATNIAMLRLWLSLAVEAEKPTALPNLDFKIEVGDSLLGPNPQQLQVLLQQLLIDADKLVEVKEKYISAHGEEKESLRSFIKKREMELKADLAAEHGEGVIDWRIQFAEAFVKNRGGFDIVITNPPYVRQELITDLKPDLKKIYDEVYAGAADLYVYFYARAIQLLRQNGLVSFIAPNKFFRAGYGSKLRNHLELNSHLLVLIDFGDFPIFQAITYPSVIVTQKRLSNRNRNSESVITYNWNSSDDLSEIGNLVKNKGLIIQQKQLRPEGWQIINKFVANTLERICKQSKTLTQIIDGRLYYGIKTGCNEAFEIDQEIYDSLVREDKRSKDIIRPWLRGRNVQRWIAEWNGKYLIFTRRGIQIDKYPAVKNYLTSYKKILEPRPDNVPANKWNGRKPGTYKWYEIQDAIDYWQEFDKPKIIYQVIATYQQFAFSSEPLVSNDKTWIIPDPPPGILGILNSKIAWFFLDQITPKLQGGAFELRSPYVSQIPIVTPTRILISKVNEIISLVSDQDADPSKLKTLENDIDEIVIQMYGLSKDDEKVIDDALAICGNRFPKRLQDTDEYKKFAKEMFDED